MNQYDQKKLLDYINAVSFALVDTTLYLDTHPDDREALEQFRQFQNARNKAVKEYSQYFEALVLDAAEIQDEFTWAVKSWPWMKERC